jgi:outer membrane lipoprotein-sorting protein
MFKNEFDFKKLIDRLGIDDRPNPAHREDLRQQMLSVFNETETRPLRTAAWQTIGRTIMKGRITKLAAAAVIIIAILVGIHHFGGSINVTTVALGDVLERIEQVQAFIYRMKMTMTGAMMPGTPAGKKEMDGTVTISNSYGMKMEITTTDANSGQEEMNQQMYILPDQKVMFMVMPEQKKYVRMEFDDDLLARMKKQNNDPRETIKQIMNCEYTELGRSVIDGVEVEGFRTTDTAFAGGSIEDVNVTLWVDVEQRLPVRTEMDFKMNEQMQLSGVIYDYQWDVQVDAGEFEPVIPEDFTAFPTDGMKMPSMTEEAAVEGLKFFAEIFGQYPKKLNLMNLMQEFSAIKNGENLTEAGLKLKEKMEQMQEKENIEKTMDKVANEVMEIMRPVQSLGMFYMMLVQDRKEPAYYGEFVTPDDVDLVLLRWKISEDEYRVIYGDLTVENVSTERLAELETALPE